MASHHPADRNELLVRLDRIDRWVSTRMARWGGLLLRGTLGIVFIWFGILQHSTAHDRARRGHRSTRRRRGEAPLTFRDGYARPEVLSDVAWLAARAAVGAERYYRSMVRLEASGLDPRSSTTSTRTSASTR
jgi:hypothetical protein